MTSIIVGCATRSLYGSSGPKAEGVLTSNQRGQESGPWGLDKARHIVPTALLVRAQCFRNELYKAVNGPRTRHIVLSNMAGSYWRHRRRFIYFEPDEIKFASRLPSLFCRQDNRRRPGEWFLKIYILGMILHELWTPVHSITTRTSQKFSKACDVCNQVSIVFK